MAKPGLDNFSPIRQPACQFGASGVKSSLPGTFQASSWAACNPSQYRLCEIYRHRGIFAQRELRPLWSDLRFLTGLQEASDRRGLVGIHVENGEQLGDLQKIVHFLRQMQQLQFALPIANRSESAHQFANP